MFESEPAKTAFVYYPELDSMRAFAVLAVIAGHMGLPLSAGGWMGVDVFFTLSGFLITSLLVAEWEQNGSVSLKNFYVRRVLRLLPPFYVMVAVYALCPLFLNVDREA